MLSSSLIASERHPFDDLDSDQRIQLECSAEASRTVYHPNGENPWYESTKLTDRGYEPLFYCSENLGVFTTGWYNDRTHSLIIAHRGTCIDNPENLFADLGIIEAAVRESAGNITQIPSHGDFTKLLTQLVQDHLADFFNNPNFLLSNLSSAEQLIVNRILKFNLLYNSTINAYQTGGGLIGTLAFGVCSVVTAVAPPVGIVLLVIGAGSGAIVGNISATNTIDGYLSTGRQTLSNTLDIMHKNTKNILDAVKEKTGNRHEISLTITGHSLGAAGALGVTARFEQADYADLTSVLFNSPGGHKGLVKIWNQNSQLPNVEPISSTQIYNVKRESCIVSRLGSIPAGEEYVFDPLPHAGPRGFREWNRILIPSHSITNLVADIFSTGT